MKLEAQTVCPMCGQKMKIAYFCRKCKKPILKMHKWHRVKIDRFSFALAHWDCKDPESYNGREI